MSELPYSAPCPMFSYSAPCPVFSYSAPCPVFSYSTLYILIFWFLISKILFSPIPIPCYSYQKMIILTVQSALSAVFSLTVPTLPLPFPDG